MEILLAKSAGFCYGVERAIDKVEHSILNLEKSIYTLGPIIHNKQVIEELENKGVYAVKDTKDISNGVIIIRSHGVEPNIYKNIELKKIELVDATCPYVKNIQKIVEKHYKKDYQIIIIGNKDHPEVIGVNGWCNNTAIIIDDIKQDTVIPLLKKTCIVAQTTISQEKFSEAISKIVSRAKEIVIYNTICNATNTRQEEAKELSKVVEAMVIIGGYHSSNTQKLVSISKRYCNNVYHIETYKDLPFNEFTKYNKIGITAGASTPDWIIEEVIKKMEKEINGQGKEVIDFKESIEGTMLEIKPGDIVTGEVISIEEEELALNIGYKSDGLVSKGEFTEDKHAILKDLVSVGNKIEVMVVTLNDGEGNVILSKKKVDDIRTREKLEEAYQNQTQLSGKIKESINGGFIIDIGIKDVFMPLSQYHIKYLKDPQSVVGQDVIGRIIEYNPQKNRIIFSQKIVLEEELKEKKEKVLNSLEEGNTITGKVKTIVKFGVFIDLGGVDGLIHISDLSWGRVKKPEDILSEGDTISAMVLEVDKEKEKVKLSLKHLTEEPWSKVFRLYSLDDVIKVKIVKIVPFGAFAELIPGVEGLIHKSQISYDNIENIEEYLTIGQEVEVKIISLDKENKKIGLSMTELQEKPIVKEIVNETVYKEDDDLTLGDIFGNLFKS